MTPVVHYLLDTRPPNVPEVACDYWIVTTEVVSSQIPHDVTCKRCRRTKVWREAQK